MAGSLLSLGNLVHILSCVKRDPIVVSGKYGAAIISRLVLSWLLSIFTQVSHRWVRIS